MSKIGKWLVGRYFRIWKSIPLSLKIGHILFSVFLIVGMLYDSIIFGGASIQLAVFQGLAFLAYSFVLLELIFLFEYSAVNLFEYQSPEKKKIDALIGRIAIRILLGIGVIAMFWKMWSVIKSC